VEIEITEARHRRCLQARLGKPVGSLLLDQGAAAQLGTLQGGEFQYAQHHDAQGQDRVSLEAANESTHDLSPYVVP
jgi:hypothetical protein